jgi:hypothetical protein
MRKLSYRDLFQGFCAIFLATSLFNGGVRASEAITLPDADANQDVLAQIQRPLDFTAVTDHAEFLGSILDPAEHPFYSPTLRERAWTSPIWINTLQTKEALS